MQYRCDACGKLIKKPDPTEPPRERYFCKTCEEKRLAILLDQDAKCRHELSRIWADVSEIAGGKVHIGMCVSINEVLVTDGIGNLAKILGEEITVVERGDEFYDFYFWHDGVRYEHVCAGYLEEDKAIIEKWRKNHETF